MAKQSKNTESAETKVEETPVVETAGETKAEEQAAEGQVVETVEEGAKTAQAEVPEGEGTTVEETETETETGTDAEQGQAGQEGQEGQEGQQSNPVVDDANVSQAEGVAEVVTSGYVHVDVEGEEQSFETYTTVASVDIPEGDHNEDEQEQETETEDEECPYTMNVAVPTVIYRGPHKSLGEKRFCGVVTVLTKADDNGFAQVEFVRPGVGLTKGYIIL